MSSPRCDSAPWGSRMACGPQAWGECVEGVCVCKPGHGPSMAYTAYADCWGSQKWWMWTFVCVSIFNCLVVGGYSLSKIPGSRAHAKKILKLNVVFSFFFAAFVVALAANDFKSNPVSWVCCTSWLTALSVSGEVSILAMLAPLYATAKRDMVRLKLVIRTWLATVTIGFWICTIFTSWFSYAEKFDELNAAVAVYNMLLAIQVGLGGALLYVPAGRTLRAIADIAERLRGHISSGAVAASPANGSAISQTASMSNLRSSSSNLGSARPPNVDRSMDDYVSRVEQFAKLMKIVSPQVFVSANGCALAHFVFGSVPMNDFLAMLLFTLSFSYFGGAALFVSKKKTSSSEAAAAKQSSSQHSTTRSNGGSRVVPTLVSSPSATA